jgi:hypothetical protein
MGLYLELPQGEQTLDDVVGGGEHMVWQRSHQLKGVSGARPSLPLLPPPGPSVGLDSHRAVVLAHLPQHSQVLGRKQRLQEESLVSYVVFA